MLSCRACTLQFPRLGADVPAGQLTSDIEQSARRGASVAVLRPASGRGQEVFAPQDSTLVLTVPALSAIGSASSPWQAFVLILGMLTIVSGYTSINAVVKAEMWLKSLGREEIFYYYVAACIFASLLVYTGMPETRRTNL